MKTINKILLAAVAVASLSLSSCDDLKDFGDINMSPNNPSTAYTSYLFTAASRYVTYFTLGSATNAYDPWTQEWAGYLSESKNNQYGPLGTTKQYSAVGTMYLNPLKNLHLIIEMNEDPEQKDLTNVVTFGSNANQIAAAKTLSAYFYMSMTDIYGPIILSEAFQGASDENWKPKYDSQESVYKQLDEMLVEAYGQFDVNGTLSKADVLYNGDIAKWKKFNASLRMMLAIKLSDVAPQDGKSRFAKAYADGAMTDVADGFNYTYDDLNWNMLYYWNNPSYSAAGFNMVPNYFIVEKMKSLEDNRMFKYFDIEGYKGKRSEEVFPRDQFTSFYGIPFGLVDNNAVAAFGDCCSSVASSLLAMNATVPVIPAARVLLVEAEAAFRGWISADAKTLYEAGIKASFDQWGADGADKYIASPAVAYNAENGLEQIAIQRWIACYLSDGVEVWSDWRRLDIPKMPVGPGAIDIGNTHYPYRLAYYTDYDVAYNEDNWKEAVAQLRGGTDDNNSRVWWDVNPNEEGVLSDEVCVPQVQLPADWKEVAKGTYFVASGDDLLGGTPLFPESFKAVVYNDANHPAEYKIAPFGTDGEYVLYFSAKGESFVIDHCVVGKTEGGKAIVATDYNTSQNTDYDDVVYFDSEENCYVFLIIYRDADGTLLWYGYDVFYLDAD